MKLSLNVSVKGLTVFSRPFLGYRNCGMFKDLSDFFLSPSVVYFNAMWHI